MIVVAERGELILITQPDHARFSSQLLSLWRHPSFREHARRDQLLLAVREHDNGWREADAAPRIDPSSGRPHDFRSLPEEPRREVWQRGIERFASENPYVALLIIQHCRRLHLEHRTAPGWSAFLESLVALRRELLPTAGVDPTTLAADYRWLRLADELSLTFCCRSPHPVSALGFTATPRDGELEIEPFPLAGATTFEIPCRRIADRHYDGGAELARALATARWTRLQARCRPSPDAL
jgi:hypothetical protein